MWHDVAIYGEETMLIIRWRPGQRWAWEFLDVPGIPSQAVPKIPLVDTSWNTRNNRASCYSMLFMSSCFNLLGLQHAQDFTRPHSPLQGFRRKDNLHQCCHRWPFWVFLKHFLCSSKNKIVGIPTTVQFCEKMVYVWKNQIYLSSMVWAWFKSF